MSPFMLLLRRPQGAIENLSAADFEELMERVRAWHHKLETSGRLVRVGKLMDDEGKTLRQENHNLVVFDGPYSETKEVIGGYFIVEANDYDDAVALAEGCPALFLGGCVEVRALDSGYRLVASSFLA